ncbi:MAG: hypothetical protein WBE76_00020 [Terracidiphilus sp.]
MPVLAEKLELKPAAKERLAGLAKLKVSAWSLVAVAALFGFSGFLFGRQTPAHHFVPYVGYPLVLDTTTGRACYAVQPKPDPSADSEYPVDSNGNRIDSSIPLCGQP